MQLILIIFFLYSLILVFLYFYQRSLLYHPNENNYSGDEISVGIEKVKMLINYLFLCSMILVFRYLFFIKKGLIDHHKNCNTH